MSDNDNIDIEALPKLEDEAEVSGFAMGGSDVVNIRMGALEGLGISRDMIGKLRAARVVRYDVPTGGFDE